MFKLVGLIAVFMLVAADVSLGPEAMPAVWLAAPSAALKGDRLDIGRRGACAWPHDDGACAHDGARPDSGVRKVHVIPADPFAPPDQRLAPDLQPLQSPQDRGRCASLPPSCWPSRGSVRAMT